MEKKTLLFSTRGNYKYPIWLPICYIIGLLALSLLLEGTEEAIGIILLIVWWRVKSTKAEKYKKSFIEIFDDEISGVAISEGIFSNSGIGFKLEYEEILNVVSEDDVVEISCNGINYKVQAHKTSEKVVNIIKQQLMKYSEN